MSDGKTIILNRIREALRENPAPRPHASHTSSDREEVPRDHTPREWLPKVGESLVEQIDLFARQSEGLKTELHRCGNMEDARAILSMLTTEGGWKKIATHTTPDTSALLEKNCSEILKTDTGYRIDDLESCDAGITGCECLVAQTGAILVSAPSAGGRALSVLPHHHIIIARTSQMVPDLTAALELAKKRYGNKFPSFLSFITGPSRTGDIERILVLGAHGPKRLTVLLLEG